jgi:hypothetical protein
MLPAASRLSQWSGEHLAGSELQSFALESTDCQLILIHMHSCSFKAQVARLLSAYAPIEILSPLIETEFRFAVYDLAHDLLPWSNLSAW